MRPSEVTSPRVASTAELCALIGDAQARGWGRVPDAGWAAHPTPTVRTC